METNEKQDINEVKPIDVDKALDVARRQEVAGIIDKCLQETNLDFYEAILGMCDFVSTILTIELSQVLGSTEERQLSQDRVNAVREPIVDILNQKKSRYLAEDMIALISLLVESVIIGIKREADARKEELESK